MAKLIQNLAKNTIGSLLNDPATEEKEQTSDRISGTVSTNATSNTQMAINQRTVFSAPTNSDDDFLSQAFMKSTQVLNVSKFIHLKTASWATTHAEEHRLMTIGLPQAFYPSISYPAYGNSRYFRYVRTGFEFEIQVNAPTGSTGCVLVVYYPAGTQQTQQWGSYPMLPSAYINISIASSAKLKVPYVSTTNYVDTDSNDLGHLDVFVFIKYIAPTGTSNTVDVAVFGSMCDNDFQNPRPQGPTRNKIDIAEGMGAMNLATRMYTKKSQPVSLCNESACIDHKTAGSKTAIKDLKELFGTPLLFGNTFTWGNNQGPATVIYQTNVTLRALNPMFEMFYNSFQFWRGSVIFSLVTYNSAFNKGRLKICFFPHQGSSYTDVQSNNSMFAIHDVGLNTTTELRVPFSQKTWMESTNTELGRFQIHVNTRLTANAASPAAIYCKVFTRPGDDFELMVPMTRGLNYQGDDKDWGSQMDSADPIAPDSSAPTEETAEAASAAGLGTQESAGNRPGDTKPSGPKFLNAKVEKIQVVKANHMTFQNLMSRGMSLGHFTLAASTFYKEDMAVPTEGYMSLMKMMGYWTGDVNFHIYNNGGNYLSVAHSYHGILHTPEALSAAGEIVIPPHSGASITAPWYNREPVKLTAGVSAMGSLHFYSGSATVVNIWQSFQNISLFFPIGVPIKATARSYFSKERSETAMTALRRTADLALLYGNLDDPLEIQKPKRKKGKGETFLDRTIKRLGIENPPAETVALMQSLWERDLTREGVESNPGPLMHMRDQGKHYFGLALTGGMPLIGQMYENPDLKSVYHGWILFDPMREPDYSFQLERCKKIVRGRRIILRAKYKVTGVEEQNYILAQLWVRDLTKEGIEPNPGPGLCYVDRGLYRHYGVRSGNRVFHMQTENILDAVKRGKVGIVCEEYSDAWVMDTKEDYSALQMAALERSATEEHFFSATDNCETYAKEALGIKGITQARALCVFGIIATAATSAVVLQGPVVDTIKKGYGKVKGALDTAAAKAVSGIKHLITESLFDNITSEIVKNIAKLLVRMLCYGILFCSSPGMLTGICVASLVAMDISSVNGLGDCTKALCSALIEGDMAGMLEAVVDLTHQNRDDTPAIMKAAIGDVRDCLNYAVLPEGIKPEGIRDFNDATMGAKNLEWWLKLMERFWTWIKDWLSPDCHSKAVKWIDQHQETITQMFTAADKAIYESTLPGMSRDGLYQDKVEKIVRRLSSLRTVLLQGKNIYFLPTVNALIAKLSSIPKPPRSESGCMRMEPIGIWIAGGAGCGKSSFAYSLMANIRDKIIAHPEYAVKSDQTQPPTTVYPHATGSQYFDAYNGQFFHIIDDMAQHRDEEDLKVICQTISSVPYNVTMADVNEKGAPYRSKIVMATTNKTDFQTTTLLSAEAFNRRFPYKFNVTTSQNFQKDDGTMDLSKAMTAGAVKTGHAWSVDVMKTVLRDQTQVMDMDKWAKLIADEYYARLHVLSLTKHTQGFSTVACREVADFDQQEIMPQVTYRVAKKEVKIVHEGKSQNSCIIDKIDSLIEEMDGVTKKEEKETQELKESCDEAILALDSSSEFSDSPFSSLRRVQEEQLEVKPATVHWIKKSYESWKEYLVQIQPYAIMAGIIATIVGAVATVCAIGWFGAHGFAVVATDQIKEKFNLFPQEQPDGEEERAYSKMKPKTVLKRGPAKVVHEGPGANQEFAHLGKMCGYFTETTMSGDTTQTHFVALGGHSVLVYGHWATNPVSVTRVNWNGLSAEVGPDDLEVQELKYEKTDEEGVQYETDLCIVKISKLPFQFKSLNQYVGTPERAVPTVLLYATTYGLYSHHVTDATPIYDYTVDQDVGQAHYVTGIRYATVTQKGMCGGMLCQKIKGAWRVVGMHHAGDQTFFGYSTRIFPQTETEGLVVQKEMAPKPYFNPSQSKLRRSPLYGIVEPAMEPAPLHPKDKRIMELEIPNLIKHASEKYRVDEFEPDEYIFNEALMEVKQRVFSGVGRQGCWDIVTALNGQGGTNPVDLKTSAGPKYAPRAIKKTDLVYKIDGIIYPTESFKEDVQITLQAIERGEGVTEFAATLKDELISSAKVQAARTRCIEACSFDFVVAFRMIMGPIFNEIYTTPSTVTGVAVGINPYLEFHGLASAMKERWYAIDYSKYDGSLSEGLMRAGAEVLASCHNNPQLVLNCMEPIIISTHLVADEIWTVKGGMPSGSPCTSVLNSICNLLVCFSSFRASGLEEMSDLTIVTYGDDVLASSSSYIKGEDVTRVIKEWFGMEATSADKKSHDIQIDPRDASFLKRQFRHFPGTKFVTGQLDIKSMLQKIQWCHGIPEFIQQLESFTQELVLHGEEVYLQVAEAIQPKLDKYRVYIPSYQERHREVYKMFFN